MNLSYSGFGRGSKCALSAAFKLSKVFIDAGGRVLTMWCTYTPTRWRRKDHLFSSAMSIASKNSSSLSIYRRHLDPCIEEAPSSRKGSTLNMLFIMLWGQLLFVHVVSL